MVCIYCGNKTGVVNSRHQKRINQTWRRRQCDACKAVFTTLEHVETASALRFKRNNRYEPFLRDKLFLSVYDSLRHRKTVLEDATALTDTILGKLYPVISKGTVEKSQLIETATQILKRFDKVAATHYAAFHPL